MYDLKYNVLWFEDDERFIESKADIFEDMLEEYGVDFFFEHHKGDKDLKNILQKESDPKRWDLILVDYNLEEDSIKGDQLIHNIKKILPYSELLFYSDSPKFLEKLKDSNFFEGVYFCQGRINLDEKVNGLIELSLRRTQNITYQRGIIIAYTIELTQIIDEIVVNMMKLDKKCSDFFTSKVLSKQFFTDYNKIDVIISRLKYEKQILTEKMKTAPKGDKEKIKNKIIEINTFLEILTDYIKIVIENRNNFAHCIISPDKPNSLKIRKNNDTEIEVNEKFCNDIRKELKKQESDLKKLSNYITEKLEELSN